MDLNPVLDVGDVSGPGSSNDAVVVVSILLLFGPVFIGLYVFLCYFSSLGGTWIRFCAAPTPQCVFA